MTPETMARVKQATREDDARRGKVHAYRKGWHPVQCVGLTKCGLETGRVLGVRLGVRVTSERDKVTCERCKRGE